MILIAVGSRIVAQMTMIKMVRIEKCWKLKMSLIAMRKALRLARSLTRVQYRPKTWMIALRKSLTSDRKSVADVAEE